MSERESILAPDFGSDHSEEGFQIRFHLMEKHGKSQAEIEDLMTAEQRLLHESLHFYPKQQLPKHDHIWEKGHDLDCRSGFHWCTQANP